MCYNADMKDKTAKKLEEMGILTGYNGFSYMCWIIEHYDAYTVSELAMETLTAQIAKEYKVSKKAVLHNLTLLLEKSWNAGADCALRRTFAFPNYMPTLKEFIATIIVMMEYCA